MSDGFWSRDRIGWWSLCPVALDCLWAWLNPRVFPRPDRSGYWMSRAVLGERTWLKRRRDGALPADHRTVPTLIAAISGVGLLPNGWGLWALDGWPILCGLILSLGGKLWFLDRMVWVVSEQSDA